MKLMIIDLDGTLFDTRPANYCAYSAAMKEFGYNLEYKFFCEYCNGRHYKDFMPKLGIKDTDIAERIHENKKLLYSNYIDQVRINRPLMEIINAVRGFVKTALVTTASKRNAYDLLKHYDAVKCFDLILTQEDVMNKKPDPEGFLKAMDYFRVMGDETLVFEDTDIGRRAAEACGADCFIVEGYH